nr:site-specific integrase [Dietzia timorensis]
MKRRRCASVDHVVKLVRPLDPAEHYFREMLSGWTNQQMARNLNTSTIESRSSIVQRFVLSTETYPWEWTPKVVDEYFSDLRAENQLQRSTIRSYQGALRAFCSYVSEPSNGWVDLCIEEFNDHPTQVFFDWNTAQHVQDYEGSPTKRAFTKTELQDFFDYADDQVDRILRNGHKGAIAAYRDSMAFKIAYSYGLRVNELRHLRQEDFSRNPHAREFGRFGQLNVLHGKASRGSSPKRRGVFTVFSWTPDIVEDTIGLAGDKYGERSLLFPTERGTFVSSSVLWRRFRLYCDELELPPGLDFHSFRRSYITHLIEDGWDPLFVQKQVGHEYASTTAIYTCVSSDFRTRTLRSALNDTIVRSSDRKNNLQ